MNRSRDNIYKHSRGIPFKHVQADVMGEKNPIASPHIHKLFIDTLAIGSKSH